MKVKKETKYQFTLNDQEAWSLLTILKQIQNQNLIYNQVIEKNVSKIVDELTSAGVETI